MKSMGSELENVTDEVADLLDELAYLGAAWAKSREKGKMPSGIRHAMISVSEEVVLMAEIKKNNLIGK